MNLTLPGRRKRVQQPAKPAPEPSVEDELIKTCQVADTALAALSVALAARRQALVSLTAQTDLIGRSTIMRAFAPSTVWAAVAHHGADRHMSTPHVMADHKRSLAQSAQAAIDASAIYRHAPAPAPSGIEKESRHGQT